MDRFIVILNKFNAYRVVGLKSNMDRFIVGNDMSENGNGNV